jgi:putative thioredoxin
MNFEVKDFQRDVIDASFQLPVVVDFWAEWCAPCRMIGPVLEKLALANQGNWKLVKIDTEANQELAGMFGIRSIPHVKLFVNGEIADEFSGALPEKKIVEWLTKLLPPPEPTEIENAAALIGRGDETKAKKILEKNISKDGNPGAKILLAKLLLFDEFERSEKLLAEARHDSAYPELADALAILMVQLTMLREGSALPDSAVKERYKCALEALTKKDFNDALRLFIDIIRDDRYYFDDAARKVCIAIFKYLGEEHPITHLHRRDFGRALYV